ncbi:class I SAM-dependent methyltransferase [Cytophagaceae bacterium ABcell3]|nr:class I SAM-dependent methyltransferase [Cytophagaceae bacterium ABcell3]
MDEQYEEKYHALENDMWWFVARRDILTYLLDGLGSKSLKILDIGCSGGVFLSHLVSKGYDKEHLYGIDKSAKAIEQCHKRGLDQCYVMDGAEISFEEGSFDVIIASDCLEHINDDAKALRNWKLLLKKGGNAFIFVPAFQFLWSPHDEINHHFRRYSKRGFINKVLQQGWEVERAGYWNCSLFFPALLIRIVKKIMKKSSGQVKDDLQMPSAFSNWFLSKILVLENRLLRIINLPIGLSIWCICRRR